MGKQLGYMKLQLVEESRALPSRTQLITVLQNQAEMICRVSGILA